MKFFKEMSEKTKKLIKEHEYKFNYIMTPLSILLDNRLSRGTKTIFGIIVATDRSEEGSFLSNEVMAELTGLGQPTVSKAYTELKELELIEINTDGRRRFVKVKCRIELTNKLSAYYQIITQPITKSLHKYNNINKSIINNTITDSEESDKNISIGKRTIPRTNSLIEFWNELPNTRKHKAGTKTYRNCAAFLLQLKKGILINNVFDQEWLDKKGLTKKDLSQKYSERKIKQGILYLSQMRSWGYWPEDKKWIKKMGLSDLIYNSRSHNSWFLCVLKNPPKLTTGPALVPDNLLKPFISFFSNGTKLHNSKTNTLNHGLFSILKFYRSLPKRAFTDGDDFGYFCPTEKKFLEHFLRKLKHSSNLKKYGPGIIHKDSKVFREYLDRHWSAETTCLHKNFSEFL